MQALTVALSFLALLSTAFPQPAQVSLQFVSFPQQARPSQVELLTGENKTVSVSISSSELSKSYSVPAMETWVIGETTKSEDGEENFAVLGQAAAIDAERQLLLLIRKGETNQDGFVIIPINATDTRFGAGKFLFVNASSTSVAVSMGGSQFALEPGKLNIIQPEADIGEHLCQVSIAYRREDRWRRLSETRWPVDDKVRALIFFYKDPRTGKIRLHAISDRTVAETIN